MNRRWCSNECYEESKLYGSAKSREGITHRPSRHKYKSHTPVTLPHISIQEPDMELYNLKTTKTPGVFIITKFDKHLEVESSYILTYDDCHCPRGQAHSNCRHRTMIHIFKQHKHVDDGWFLDYHTRQWVPPVDLDTNAPEAHEREPAPLPAAAAPVDPPPAVASGAPKPRVLGLRGL